MLLTLALMAASEAALPAQSPDVMFAGLSGSCWRGDMPGGATDTHCFTVAGGGKLGLDVHKVRGSDGMVVYEGVTTYRPEAATGKVSFGYYTSLGDLLPGTAWRDGNDLHVIVQMPNGPMNVTWHVTGDGFDVTNPMLPGPVHFSKVGPADGGL